MRNEYGEKLDSNGYAASLLPSAGECFLCDKVTALQRHEVFHGANRKKSKNLGCWVTLCDDCHKAVHGQQLMSIKQSISLDEWLKQTCQKAAMYHFLWDTAEFRQQFGKNYLKNEDEINGFIAEMKGTLEDA